MKLIKIYNYMLNPFPNRYSVLPVSMHSIRAEWPIEHVLHWHEEIEIIYQAEGCGFFHVHGSEYKLEAGQAIIVNSGENHSTFHPGFPSSGFIYNIGIRQELLCSRNNDICQSKYIDPLLQNEFKLPNVIHGNCSWEKEVLSYIERIIKLFADKPYGFELAIKVSVFNILSTIVLSGELNKAVSTDEASGKNKEAKLRSVLEYIHRNYSQKISLSSIAEEFKISQAHLSRFFKTMTGHTLVEYINQFRINKSTALLGDKNRRITDIAFEVGFDSPGYFTETFKRLKKCTPGEYREFVPRTKAHDLPDGWNNRHIGLSIKPGSVIYDNGMFSVSSLGQDIGYLYDDFEFVYIQVSGDCEITARINCEQNTDAGAKAGIMIRETLQNNSRCAYALINPCNEAVAGGRYAAGELAHHCTAAREIEFPLYLKIERKGNNFLSYHSRDGEVWEVIGGTVRIDMNSNVYIGLAVTSSGRNFISTVTFDEVKIRFDESGTDRCSSK